MFANQYQEQLKKKLIKNIKSILKAKGDYFEESKIWFISVIVFIISNFYDIKA